MEWVNQLKQKLKSFIHERAFELGLPHLASAPSSLFLTYQRLEGNVAPSSQQMDGEMSERLVQMQKTLVNY